MLLNDKLIEACKAGSLTLVKRLVEAGADIHAWNDWPLYAAIVHEHLEVIKYLVENGAEVVIPRNGSTEIIKYLKSLE